MMRTIKSSNVRQESRWSSVIQELGADRNDGPEWMQIADLNTDGSVTADEFNKFRYQIQILQNLARVDREFTAHLGSKLQQKSIEPGAELAICAKTREPGCSKNVDDFTLLKKGIGKLTL